MIYHSAYIQLKVFAWISLLLAVIVICSCSSQEIFNEDIYDNGDEIAVVARISRQANSRAYQESGKVTEGRFTLSYPLASKDDEYYNVAYVDFDKTESKGIGIVTVPEDKPFKWIDIGGGANPTMYMDNVATALMDTVVSFENIDCPYKAGVFDSIGGTNDLLWGAATVSRETKTVNFELHHNMARVRVKVTLDKSKAEYGSELTLKGAKVTISSLNQSPLSFNRLTGDLMLDTEDGAYTDLTLVNDNDENGKIEWINPEEITDEKDIVTGITPDFVLPPQGLLEDDRRPRLTIELANGDIYSGILPHAMLIDDGSVNSTEPTYPVALYFLKEHILTIHTVITEEPPTLAFMPVWVMNWVYKGEFDSEAHQAGIYTAEELYKLIKYYQSQNTYQLQRYGSFDNETWTFDFWHSVVLDFEEIKEKMSPGEKFQFRYNNYKVFVRSGEDDTIEPKSVTPERLRDILMGKISTFESI